MGCSCFQDETGKKPRLRSETFYNGYYYRKDSESYSFPSYSFPSFSGCYSGNGKVLLKNKTVKQVKDLTKGDILEDGSIIQCLIVIKVNRIVPAIELNGVYFTFKHPVFYEGKWTNPINIKAPINAFIDNWYNLVLKNGNSVKINGIEAITLGHGSHPYFGTKKVLMALKKYDGFESGRIVVEKQQLNVERDENGRISNYF